LRGEISKLWQAGTFPARSILLVTHNIEEAVMLADRVIILGTNPGTIRGELTITLRRPRQAKNSEFRGLLDYIYKVMTDPTATVEDVSSLTKRRFPTLPHVRAGGVSGLLEIIADQGGEADLPALAEQLRLEVDDLLPVVDAAVMLGFASTSEGDVRITDTGRAFVAADIDRSWWIFRIQILERVPLVRTILHILQQKRDGGVKREFFTDILAEHFSESEAEAQLDTLITWGRYAQLFDYDADEQRLFLSTPSEDWETASPAAAQQRELEQHEKTDTGKI
jgi:NitT/TauT family transport system ATP-binding protein